MTVSLEHVTFDCANAADLAAFWAGVLERPVDEGANEYFATIGYRGPERLEPAWMFIKVPEGKTAKNRMHADLGTDDLEADIARVIDLGAKHVGDFAEHGTRWASFRDPEGNEFDIGVTMR